MAYLVQLDELCGPKPGRPAKPVVLVEDNGPAHLNSSRSALAPRSQSSGCTGGTIGTLSIFANPSGSDLDTALIEVS